MKSCISLFPIRLRFCASGNNHRCSAASNSAVASTSERCASSSPHPATPPALDNSHSGTHTEIYSVATARCILQRRECSGRERRRPSNCAYTRAYARTYARAHARTHENRVVTLPRAAYVYFRRRKRDTRCTREAAADPSLPFKSRRRTASSQLAPCRDMGVVEAWETRDRGGCSYCVRRVGENGREYRGLKGTRARCMKRKEEREREEKVRRCEKAEDRDGVTQKTWTKRRASESIAFTNERGKEGARSDERRKNEGDEETRMP